MLNDVPEGASLSQRSTQDNNGLVLIPARWHILQVE